jgi:hypothetical protein
MLKVIASALVAGMAGALGAAAVMIARPGPPLADLLSDLAAVGTEETFARYGMPLPNLAGARSGNGGQDGAPGKVVSDRDALR